jgi:hypothetical protein
MVISSKTTEKVKFAHVDLSRSDGTFFTPDDWRLQTFTPVIKSGKVEKHIHDTPCPQVKAWGHPEAWFCLSGHCEFSVYDINGALTYSGQLMAFHLLNVEIGGNSIEAISKDFRILEMKLGPYQQVNRR